MNAGCGYQASSNSALSAFCGRMMQGEQCRPLIVRNQWLRFSSSKHHSESLVRFAVLARQRAPSAPHSGPPCEEWAWPWWPLPPPARLPPPSAGSGSVSHRCTSAQSLKRSCPGSAVSAPFQSVRTPPGVDGSDLTRSKRMTPRRPSAAAWSATWRGLPRRSCGGRPGGERGESKMGRVRALRRSAAYREEALELLGARHDLGA